MEVPFQLGDQRLGPDRLIRVTRGAKSWTALVEVKTGSNELQAEQLENWLDIAREHAFDCLISISNEIPPNRRRGRVSLSLMKDVHVAICVAPVRAKVGLNPRWTCQPCKVTPAVLGLRLA